MLADFIPLGIFNDAVYPFQGDRTFYWGWKSHFLLDLQTKLLAQRWQNVISIAPTPLFIYNSFFASRLALY